MRRIFHFQISLFREICLQEKCKKNKEESLLELYVQLETERSKLKAASKDNEEKDEILKQMKNDLGNAKEKLNELRIVQRGKFLCFLMWLTRFFIVTIRS